MSPVPLTKALTMVHTAADMIQQHLESQTIAGRERAARYNNSLKQWTALVDHIFTNPEQFAHKIEQALRTASTDDANQIQVHPNGVLWLQGAYDLQALRNALIAR